MKKITSLLILLLASTKLISNIPEIDLYNLNEIKDKKIITATKRIYFEKYADAYNPSILKVDGGFLMSFRYSPERYTKGWESFIYVVKLNENLDPISEPQVLDCRFGNPIPSQSEDARLFSYRNKIYLIYNDNEEEVWYNYDQRRDMYMAELKQDGDSYCLERPIKLKHGKNYPGVKAEKNWVPFEWNDQLFITYTINPHEVLLPDLATGICHPIFETSSYMNWIYGPLRGSAPPQLVDGEYLSFFHSSCYCKSPASKGEMVWHYFIGAYTFAANPPFELTRMTPFPLVTKGFYTYLIYWKRVIFPGGFAVSGNNIYLAYGKDDWEIWIATIDKKELFREMQKLHTVDSNIFD